MSMSFHEAARTPPPRPAYGGLERRAQDPVRRLARRLDAVCITAVDPLQIAAALEADGLSDTVAAARYGAADVFALADELYRIVPLRPRAPASRCHVPSDTARDLLHGPLYAVPGLVYASMLPQLATGPATLALLLGVALGWSWSQGMARLALRMDGRGHEQAASVILRRGVGLALVGSAAIGVALAGTFGPATWLLIGQATYQALAVALTQRRCEALLLLAVAPATAAALAQLLGLTGAGLTTTIAGVVATLVLGLAAVAYATRHRRGSGVPLRLRTADVVDALPAVLYAALAAAILALEPLRASRGGAAAGLGWSLAPLVLTMGVLEWQLRGFRAAAALAAAVRTTSAAFARHVFLRFTKALTLYLATLAGASWTLLAFAPRWALDADALAPALAALGLLGAAFFVALALTAQGRATGVVVAAAIGFGTGLAAALTAPEMHATAIASATFLALLLLGAPRWLTELRGYRDVVLASDRIAAAPRSTHRRRSPWARSSPSPAPTASSARI
jgi:hypothetical protein